MSELLTIIVLAAGLSRRMGKENKLLLPFGETTMLGATLSNILAARVGETLVVVGHEAEEVVKAISHKSQATIERSVFSDESDDKTTYHLLLSTFHSPRGPLSINDENDVFFRLLMNNHYEKGMTTTIQTGIEAASEASVGYMICLSDMPFIAPEEYRFLAQQFLRILADDPQAIVQPTYAGQRGNPTIFARFYRETMLNLTYSEGCKPIVQANAAHVYLVEMPTNSVLKDIDSREEYAKIGDVR
jgi:molybdenum cofactor cytidylyltransferase